MVHKIPCAVSVASDERTEQMGLSDPRMSSMESDITTWWRGRVGDESAHLALRPALRLGRTDTINRSHFLRLTLRYNPSPVELRQRFTLIGAEAASFENELRVNPDRAFCANLRSAMPFSPDQWLAGEKSQEGRHFGVTALIVHHVKGYRSNRGESFAQGRRRRALISALLSCPHCY